MEHLKSLSQLRALRFSAKDQGTTVDDDGMEAISHLKSLKVLALDHLWVSEVGLEQLTAISGLEELYMAQSLAGDEAIALLPSSLRSRNSV